MKLAKHLRGVAKNAKEVRFRRYTRELFKGIKQEAGKGGRLYNAQFHLLTFGEEYYEKLLEKVKRHGFVVEEDYRNSTIYTKYISIKW